MHRRAALAGLLGLGFAESVGGGGGGALDVATVAEAMLLAGAPSGLLAALFTHGIALPHMVESGNQALVDAYVRPTLAGELIGALAVTEPDGGSDVSAIRTTARLEGDHYRVNGAKTYITSGVRADFLTTLVRTGGPGRGGLSLLVIDKGSPGLTVTRRLAKLGWLCSDTAELAFVDVAVPSSHLIGEEGDAFRSLAQHFSGERLALAIHAVGIAGRCFALTLDWCRQRRAFGSPLIDKQVVRHTLVDMLTATETARAFTWRTLEAVAEGNAGFVEAAMAKNAAVQACAAVVDAALQLHGGMGYMHGSEVERHYRDARVLGIGGGATEVMKDLIARGSGW